MAFDTTSWGVKSTPKESIPKIIDNFNDLKQSIDNFQTVVSGGYTHQQLVASSVWIITHNLNKYPAVTVIDSANSIVVGEVEYDSKNQCTLKFNGGFSGTAVFN